MPLLLETFSNVPMDGTELAGLLRQALSHVANVVLASHQMVWKRLQGRHRDKQILLHL